MERPSKKKANDVANDIAEASNDTSKNDVSKLADNGETPHAHEDGPEVSKKEEGQEDGDRFRRLFGFSLSDLSSWDSFVRLMSRPADPSSLAYVRISFGLLMFLDVFEERGLSHADHRWSNEEECRFPLFEFLKPLPLHLMVLLYMIMSIASIGIVLGYKYRGCCFVLMSSYWYILLLEKSRWNNHSYLFGILSFLHLLCDSNRYWSLDGLFNPKIRNAHVPLWNYTLLRTQVFLVYFLAGLKKIDYDWMHGYSMTYLSDHWIFEPFKLVMTDDQVDVVVVHIGGFMIDLFVGFLLFFDKTRLVGTIISSSFHLMNAQLFSIGMFPYGMLALTPLFYYCNWPKALFRRIPRAMRIITPDDDDDDAQPSEHCLYTKEQAKTELMTDTESTSDSVPKQLTPPTKPTFRHHAAAAFTVFYILWQLFLPHSHFITKGFNSWTQGLYGYSWDMMIHTRNTQHVRITYLNKDTGERGYLDPDGWAASHRWTTYPDMMKQQAECIAHRLKKHDIHNVELYFDIWISLNKRFQQRVVNPYVDILTAEWNVFEDTPWALPLLSNFSHYRHKIKEIEDKLFNSSDLYEVVFLADFPGMYLENYVNEGIGNFTVTVLEGQVAVEVLPENEEPYNITVNQGEKAQIPTGVFHNVHTVSPYPSCYMYIYINTAEVTFMEELKELELALNGSLDNPVPEKYADDPKLDQYMEVLRAKYKEMGNPGIPPEGELKVEQPSRMSRFLPSALYNRFLKHLAYRYGQISRGFRLVKASVKSVLSGKPYNTILKEMNEQEKKAAADAKNTTKNAGATKNGAGKNTTKKSSAVNGTKETKGTKDAAAENTTDPSN